jgi:putative transcriptional regulator
MEKRSKRLPVAEQIRKGMEEAIQHARGEIKLKTYTLELPDPPPQVRADELTKLRLDSGMSQAIFARVLNVSPKTVQSWEQGSRRPSQAALRLLQLFQRDASFVLRAAGIEGPNGARATGRRSKDARST